MAACADKKPGDACTVQDDGKTLDGTCHALPSGKLVCFLPPPPPLQAAVDACAKSQTGDACSFAVEDDTLNGACRAAPTCGPPGPARCRSSRSLP